MKKIYLISKIVCLAFLLGAANNAFALSCKLGTSWAGAIKDTMTISDTVLVSNKDVAAGTVLWRSSPQTTQFTCFDYNHLGKAEQAFFYFDPQGTVASLPSFVELGITIGGMDYPIKAGGKLLAGQGTVLPSSNNNCADMGIVTINPITWTWSCTTPKTLLVNYTIYIKAKGSATTLGPIAPNNSYSLFQIDGYQGLNIKKDSNFNLYLNGLNNVKFVDCVPNVAINGANTNGTVNFGPVTVPAGSVNTIIKRVPFDLAVTMTLKGSTVANNECANKDLLVSFVSASVKGNNTILPNGRTDLGIQILPSGDSTPVTLNSATPLGRTDSAASVVTSYDAALLPLVDQPAVGTFSAIVNVEVTFK